MKKYRLISGELRPLGRGLGGQLSISGQYITIWDIGPRAKNKSLKNSQRKIFALPAEKISAFDQDFIIGEPEKSAAGWELLVYPAAPPTEQRPGVAAVTADSGQPPASEKEVLSPQPEHQAESAPQPLSAATEAE